MTKLTKSVLMTIFSAILIVLTALGVMLTAPVTAKAEELPDYLNWTRTEAKAGDLLANRYVLFSKSENESVCFDIEGETWGPEDWGEIRFGIENGSAFLIGWLSEADNDVISMDKLYEDNNYAVFYVEPFNTNYVEKVPGTKKLTASSRLGYDYNFYFIEDNGATLPDGGETPENGTLPEITGVNYNAVYPQKGDKFDNTAYLCVPVTVDDECIISFEGGKYIGIKGYDEVTFEGEKIEPVAVTNRYGVKAYVYDVSSVPANLTVSMIAGTDGLDVYTLVLKTGAEPETPTPNPSNPGNGGNENPGNENPGNENPGEENPGFDIGKWLDQFLNDNLGLALGSTGALVFVFVLILIFKRR